MHSKNTDLCEGSIFKKIVMLFIPILLAGFLQQFFNAADVVLAGNLTISGSDAVAAVGSTTAITKLMINFFIGCSTGSAVTVSQAIGSKRKDEISAAVHTAITLALVLGGILSIIGVILAKPLLVAISTPSNIINLSVTYLRIYFLSMIPYMLYNFSAAILRSFGETKKPLYFLLISGPIKLILTVFFVSYLKLDVAGIALAGTFSQFVSAVLGLIALIKRKDEGKLKLNKLGFYKNAFKKILFLGIPSGIQSATFSLSNVFIQSSVNSLSYINGFITGNAAASSFEGFTDSLTSAFYSSVMTFVGQNVGAKKYKRVKTGIIYTHLFAFVVTAVSSALICIFSKQIIGIYIKDSTEAIFWGTTKLICVFSFLVLQALMDVTVGSLKGMGISFSSMLISLIGVCGVRILWASTVFLIPIYHTPQVLFTCYPVSWAITFIAETILLIYSYKKQKRKYYTKSETS